MYPGARRSGAAVRSATVVGDSDFISFVRLSARALCTKHLLRFNRAVLRSMGFEERGAGAS